LDVSAEEIPQSTVWRETVAKVRKRLLEESERATPQETEALTDVGRTTHLSVLVLTTKPAWTEGFLPVRGKSLP
jgi:hypothetical protein